MYKGRACAQIHTGAVTFPSWARRAECGETAGFGEAAWWEGKDPFGELHAGQHAHEWVCMLGRHPTSEEGQRGQWRPQANTHEGKKEGQGKDGD